MWRNFFSQSPLLVAPSVVDDDAQAFVTASPTSGHKWRYGYRCKLTKMADD